ncbi:MAG: DUF4340 domain-containing protein [Deltaproteobacteria bacterium]|nr:DUF4340 domain-containing protein [Deltaproteobacteria bacterium]
MRKVNQILGLVALGLILVSALSYYRASQSAERFERGRKFLPNLNPEEVAAIAIEKGGEALTLERSGEAFTIAEKDGYRARNEEVNRFLKGLLDLSLEKEVGRGEKLAEELEIEPAGEETIAVTLTDTSGKQMVSLRLGKSFEEGGVYAQRLDVDDEMIYLTSSSPGLSTSADVFLKKEIVDVAASEVTRIQGPDFLVEEIFEEIPAAPAGEADSAEPSVPSAPGEGELPAVAEVAAPERISLGLKLAEVPSGKKESSTAIGDLKSALSRLEFTQVYPADAPEVRGLDFQQVLEVALKDTSGYLVATAEKDGTHYLSIQGFSTVDRVEIAPDESEEELKEKADTLSRADEIRNFNAFHGSWVYEIEERFVEKLGLRKADLVEEA